MDLDLIWQDYGLDRLEEGIARLFPERSLNLEQLQRKYVRFYGTA